MQPIDFVSSRHHILLSSNRRRAVRVYAYTYIKYTVTSNDECERILLKKKSIIISRIDFIIYTFFTGAM